MKFKRMIFITLIITILIFILFFLVYYYKKNNIGNTIINQSEESIVENILNIKSYEAKLDITVETNKNKTHYIILQTLENGNAKQEVLEPENISGVITQYNGNELRIRNNKLNLETTFQGYQYIVKNSLWLESFIEDYKLEQNNTMKTVNNNEIILEVRTNENPYNFYKKLYIDKNTGKPIKMIVQDINQKTLVYILYNEIKIS